MVIVLATLPRSLMKRSVSRWQGLGVCRNAIFKLGCIPRVFKKLQRKRRADLLLHHFTSLNVRFVLATENRKTLFL